jgi:flagellar biosynthetic protein FlhB
MSDVEENKSEEASSYKLEQARKKGMVPKSQELGMLIGLACCGGYFWARGDLLSTQIARLSQKTLAEAATLSTGSGALITWTESLIWQTFLAVAPLAGAILAGTLLATLVQIGFLFAPSALKADLSRLNPMQGLKRIFSVQLLIEAAKACAKMLVYAVIATMAIAKIVHTLTHASMDARGIAGMLSSSALHLLSLLMLAALVFAAIDQVLVRRLFSRKMRMSRHEMKQEHRQREGDPRIKQRRKQLQRELLKRSQSMRGVRGADVLITNPTHLAVGLRYEPSRMTAPVLVAKGSGDFALRLRKLAFIYGVPVIESKQLARQLFRATNLDAEIPSQFYRDTAAVFLRIRRQASGAARA